MSPSSVFGSCIFVAFVGGCGGATADSGGAPSSSPPATTSGGPGAERHDDSTNPALAATCDGVAGLTGQSVLDTLDVPSGGMFHRSHSDAVEPTPLVLRIHYEGGAVECVPAHSAGAQTNPSLVPATVRVHVKVDFATGDGLFDEHFDGTLESEGQSDGFEAVVDVQNLAGSYKSIAEGDELGASVPVWFHGSFLKGQKLGSMGYVGHGVNHDAFGYYEFK
jgi:hypothetical protein